MNLFKNTKLYIVLFVASFLTTTFIIGGLQQEKRAFADDFSFSPTADSYVNSDLPSANYGNTQTVRIDGSPIVRTYIKFDLQNLPTLITNAEFKIFANSTQNTGIDVRVASSSSWTETNINFSNAPVPQDPPASRPGAITAGQWLTVNVTSLVQGKGNGSITFVVSTTGSTAVSLGSRESANPPSLVISGQSPTPTSMPGATVMPTPVIDPPEDSVIVAVGDIACDPASLHFNNGNGTTSNCKQRAVSQVIANINPSALLALGDIQYEDAQYQKFLASYDVDFGQFKAKTYPTAGGSHDGYGLANSGYYQYFGAMSGEPNKGWYAVNIGAWRIYGLNGNCSKIGGCGVGSPQELWLRQDMAANTNKCQIIMDHYPYLTSDERNHDDPLGFKSFDNAEIEPLLKTFYDFGGDVFLAGHTHFYERFKPYRPGSVTPVEVHPFDGTKFRNISDPTLDEALGIRQFIVGTGGRNVYIPNNMTPAGAWPDPDGDKYEQFSEFSSTKSGTFGVLKMTLRPDSYEWQFVPIQGQTFTDSGTAICH